MVTNLKKYSLIAIVMMTSYSYTSTQPCQKCELHDQKILEINQTLKAEKEKFDKLQKKHDELSARKIVRMQNWLVTHMVWPTITPWRIAGIIAAVGLIGTVICLANQEDNNDDCDAYYNDNDNVTRYHSNPYHQ